VAMPSRRACLAGILLAAALAFAVPAAPAVAHPNMSVTFEAPRDLLDPATRDAALQELDSLGVRSLRVVLYWYDVAPEHDSGTRPAIDETDPSNYDWDRYDALIDAARARGWPVLMTVSGPVPRWATRSGRDTVTRPSPSRFQQFMTAVGRHYAGRVATWSIWRSSPAAAARRRRSCTASSMTPGAAASSPPGGEPTPPSSGSSHRAARAAWSRR